MSRKTDPVIDKQIGRTEHVNFLRDEARASSYLLAYGDTTTSTLKVLINAGVVYFGGNKVEFAGGYSPEMTEPTTSSRIDVVSMASSAEIVVTVGTEADTPTAPDVPAEHMPICEVYHKAGEVKITDEDEEAGEGYINKDLRRYLEVGLLSVYAASGNAKDTVYQNGSKWRMVMASINATGAASRGTAKIDATDPPATVVCDAGGSADIYTSFVFLVPPLWYYKIEQTVGNLSILYWFEADFSW